MTKLRQALNTINFNDMNGDYGLNKEYEFFNCRVGFFNCRVEFFNCRVEIDGENFDVIGCAINGHFDPAHSSHREGICGDVNFQLATKLAEDWAGDISDGYDGVEEILMVAWDRYNGEPTYEEWKEEFKKLTTQYIMDINWDSVIFNDGEIEQAGDDLQLDAYRNCYNGRDENSDLSFWYHYEESCEDRMDFQHLLSDKWNEVLSQRINSTDTY